MYNLILLLTLIAFFPILLPVFLVAFVVVAIQQIREEDGNQWAKAVLRKIGNYLLKMSGEDSPKKENRCG